MAEVAPRNAGTTTSDAAGRRRALVLGGGGVSGIAWEVGVLVGLRDGGVDIHDWDLVVGTSAGSIVGARLAGGSDLDAFYAAQSESAARSSDGWVRTLGGRVGAFMLMVGRRRRLAWVPRLWLTGIGLETLIRERARRRRPRDPEGPSPTRVTDPNPVLARVGRLALAARTAPEEAFVDIVASLLEPVTDWPETLAVTAVDAWSGATVVFDARSDVPLARAVAASCSLPTIMPPVTIGGRQYVDGGVASDSHLGLAVGHDEVVAITPLDYGRAVAEAEALRTLGRRFEVVRPSEAGRAAIGRDVALLDPDRRALAARAGREDGCRAAERFASVLPA